MFQGFAVSALKGWGLLGFGVVPLGLSLDLGALGICIASVPHRYILLCLGVLWGIE